MSGNKKGYNNHDDDDFDQLGGGDMSMYEDYKKFDVDVTSTQLSVSAKKLIIGLCDIYLNNGSITDDEYIKAVADTEQQNLLMLMKQVKYSEHVLDSLMRQLDNGGYVDKEIYSTIRTMQTHAMQITMDVSRYTRSLPEYFRFLQKDVAVNIPLEILVDAAENRELIESESVQKLTGDEKFSSIAPQRGLREMMLEISDVRKDIQNAITAADSENSENSEQITSIDDYLDDEPVSNFAIDEDEDEDEYTESLEDDLV